MPSLQALRGGSQKPGDWPSAPPAAKDAGSENVPVSVKSPVTGSAAFVVIVKVKGAAVVGEPPKTASELPWVIASSSTVITIGLPLVSGAISTLYCALWVLVRLTRLAERTVAVQSDPQVTRRSFVPIPAGVTPG